MCDCQVCQDIRRWKVGLENPKTRDQVFEEMFSRIEEAETDRDHYKEILSGRWPNSVSILTRALEKATGLDMEKYA